MKKVLVIGGLTATGKSNLAIDWAKMFNGEIVSVDSVAVYKQLSISSAKPSISQQQGVVHYGIDLADITNPISVKEFVDYARNAINTIHQKDKLPILVGGSGLYLKAILYDYEFLKEDTQNTSWSVGISNEQLYNQLKQLDCKQAQNIHPNNRKRLIRALTFVKTHGIRMSESNENQSHTLMYDALLFFLDANRQTIRQRIDDRVDRMIESGLEHEIKEASKIADWSLSSMSAIGVKEWKAYFEKEQSLEQVIQSIKTKTKQFSKRQRTWFKHQFDGTWIDIDNTHEIFEAQKRIAQWKQHSIE